METRQLSYFIVACQHKNHAEAAAHAGISASALSENLRLLEEELGIKLFQRGPLGHYPSEAARWLYQRVEVALQRIEALEGGMPARGPRRFTRLEVTTPLQFMLGRLSRATSLAVRALRRTHPHALARVRFRTSWPEGEEEDDALPVPVDSEPVEHVVLEYAEDAERIAPRDRLFEDDWIAITNFDRSLEPGRVIAFADLARLRLLLPPLLPAQTRHARAYCARHGLPEPAVIEEDVGTFPTLSRDARPFALLAPRSLVAGGLSRLQLDHVSLPAALVSPVAARIADGSALGAAYVRHLKRVLAEPDRPVLYDPHITLRQMRYVLTLYDQLNMTAAARKLHVVQPALSNQLRKLETVVGEPLFERRRTGLKPTAVAETIVPLVEETVELLSDVAVEARRRASEQGRRLTVGVVPLLNHRGALVAAITGALEEWSAAYPDVRLRVVEGAAAVLHRWVETGRISLGLVEARVSRSLQLDLDSKDRLVVVSRAGGGLLAPGEVALARVAALPLVLPSEIFGLRQLLNRAAAEAGVTVTPRMEVDSLAVVLGMVRRMPVATVMPEATVQPFVADGSFQVNAIADPAIHRRLSIIFSTSRSLTEIERALVDTLKRHLASASVTPASWSDSARSAAPARRTEAR